MTDMLQHQRSTAHLNILSNINTRTPTLSNTGTEEEVLSILWKGTWCSSISHFHVSIIVREISLSSRSLIPQENHSKKNQRSNTGARNRAMVATDMNAHSSRSHTIFQVMIERKPLDTGIGADTKIIRSKINLVDLAGSEKWKPHQLNRFSEKRIQEMTSINQSLSNLGNCVRALLERRRQHIPYRNSKLTRLLPRFVGW